MGDLSIAIACCSEKDTHWVYLKKSLSDTAKKVTSSGYDGATPIDIALVSIPLAGWGLRMKWSFNPLIRNSSSALPSPETMGSAPKSGKASLKVPSGATAALAIRQICGPPQLPEILFSASGSSNHIQVPNCRI